MTLNFARILPVLLSLVLLCLPQPATSGFLRDRLQGHKHSQVGSHGLGIASEDWAPAGAKRLADLAYGSADKQKLDVYLPRAPHNAPTIIMVHGGAWFIGDKGNSGVTANKLTYWGEGKGYIFVSVNYRLVPEANPLQQAHDVAKAIAYVQRNLPQWGGDPHQVIIMGHSAGAHLVGLLGANPALAAQDGAQRWRGTVVLDSAAMDIVSTMQKHHPRFYDKAFGSDETLWRAASPLQQLAPTATPMLVVCSERRGDKPCIQSEQFVRKAKGLGVQAILAPQDKGHGSISKDLGEDPVYTRQVDSFITQALGGP
ncbi:MAG: alpha/beta hydrolase [Alphaproteobacteria bacterium]|nr:alpha/beta hydrolase [Alphaproteobacteria bacterium]